MDTKSKPAVPATPAPKTPVRKLPAPKVAKPVAPSSAKASDVAKATSDKPEGKPEVETPAAAGVASNEQKAVGPKAEKAPKKAKPKAEKAPKKAKPAKEPKVKPAKEPKAKPAKEPKVKLVRDSFTMPADDYALIEVIKTRAVHFHRPAKKSELLRAGLHALAAMSDASLEASLNALTPVKTGRPKGQGRKKK